MNQRGNPEAERRVFIRMETGNRQSGRSEMELSSLEHFLFYLIQNNQCLSIANSPPPRISPASIAGSSSPPEMRRRSTIAVWPGCRTTRKSATTRAASSLPDQGRGRLLTIPPCRSTGQALVHHSGKLIEDVGWLWDHAHPSTILSGVEGSGASCHRPRLPDFQPQ